MTVADTLRAVGRPVAYYPILAKRLGGVNAAVFFCQILYWMDKAESPLGVHKSRDELELETGLTHEEQMTARRKLKAKGVLIETAKRIDHKVYFLIDENALEALLAPVSPETVKPGSGKPQSTVSGNRKSPLPETVKRGSGKPQKTVSRNGQPRRRDEGNHGSVNGTETTAETTKKSSSNVREKRPVDKSTAAAAASSKKDLTPELAMLALLAALPRCLVDAAKDRVFVLTWVGRSVSAEQLAEAHRRALAARERDTDDRPIYAAFLARFVDEVLSPGAVAGGGSAACDGPWWKGDQDVIDAKGAELDVRPRKPDEHWHSYRVLVAAASRESGAVEFVLADAKRFNNERLYKFARSTFGDALMPVDDYAS